LKSFITSVGNFILFHKKLHSFRPRISCGPFDMENKIRKVRENLERMNYGLVGNTSAVQICRWTKNALRGEGGCWKEKFYGVKSSGCVQMTPSVMWCENKCLHCWRPIEMNLGTSLPEVDDPVEILDGIIAKRREMLMGMKGNSKVDASTFEGDIEPSLFTMSLSGEPTLYPRLGELFAEIRRREKVSFLVTNGLNPDVIRGLEKTRIEKSDKDNGTLTNADDTGDGKEIVNGLPTQLVVSTNAPNEELFLKWHRSSKRDAWERFLETLDVMRELEGKVRRVVRLTLVKKGSEGEFVGMTNMGDDNVDEYVDLIRRAGPDFVHVKGYKAVGYAKDRMGYDSQVWHDEVRGFAEKILERLSQRDDPKGPDGYSIRAEEERSCVVCVARDGVGLEIERV
jgi:tRNA wybutosine-synthesizing protein 1